MPDERKWGWAYHEEAHGLFDSKEEAVQDALYELGPDTEIEVDIGRCKLADPTDYLKTDVDDLLEELDQQAGDNDFSFAEDEIFEIEDKDKEEAQKELKEVMSAWAKKYVHTKMWILEDTEEVIIGPVNKENKDG